MVGALSYSPWELTPFLELPYCTQGQTPVPRNGPGPSLTVGPEALVTPSSQDPVRAQGTIMTFEPTLLGLFFGTVAQSQEFYCLWYWLEPLATSCPQAYWLGSYGASKEPSLRKWALALTFLEDWAAAQLTAAEGLAPVPDVLCLVSSITLPSCCLLGWSCL